MTPTTPQSFLVLDPLLSPCQALRCLPFRSLPQTADHVHASSLHQWTAAHLTKHLRPLPHFCSPALPLHLPVLPFRLLSSAEDPRLIVPPSCWSALKSHTSAGCLPFTLRLPEAQPLPWFPISPNPALWLSAEEADAYLEYKTWTMCPGSSPTSTFLLPPSLE